MARAVCRSTKIGFMFATHHLAQFVSIRRRLVLDGKHVFPGSKQQALRLPRRPVRRPSLVAGQTCRRPDLELVEPVSARCVGVYGLYDGAGACENFVCGPGSLRHLTCH